MVAYYNGVVPLRRACRVVRLVILSTVAAWIIDAAVYCLVSSTSFCFVRSSSLVHQDRYANKFTDQYIRIRIYIFSHHHHHPLLQLRKRALHNVVVVFGWVDHGYSNKFNGKDSSQFAKFCYLSSFLSLSQKRWIGGVLPLD